MKDRRNTRIEKIERSGRRMTDLSLHDRIVTLENNQADFAKDMQEIKEMLRPIAETYTTVSKIGKWGTALLVFVSVVIGIVIGLKSLFK